MNAYHNMSCPPKSNIRKVIRPIGRHIVLCLPSLQTPPLEDVKACDEWLEKFMLEHKEQLEKTPQPTGYVIPVRPNGVILDEDIYPGYRWVHDIVLTVAVLGRMSGGIYIPHREIRLCQALKGEMYAFPAKYFPQYCCHAGRVPLPDNGRAGAPRTPQGGVQ